MIELRWIIRERTKSKNTYDMTTYTERYKVLQYRVLVGYVDAGGAYNVSNAEYSKWVDVPIVESK